MIAVPGFAAQPPRLSQRERGLGVSARAPRAPRFIRSPYVSRTGPISATASRDSGGKEHTHSQGRKVHPSQCPRLRRLQLVDPIRGVSSVHGGCRGGPATNDQRLHWKASIAGKDEAWDARTTEQTPDRVVAWKSTSGAANTGAVGFATLGPNLTQVTVRIGYDPEGIVEPVGDKLGFVSRRVEGDLQRFKGARCRHRCLAQRDSRRPGRVRGERRHLA